MKEDTVLVLVEINQPGYIIINSYTWLVGAETDTIPLENISTVSFKLNTYLSFDPEIVQLSYLPDRTENAFAKNCM